MKKLLDRTIIQILIAFVSIPLCGMVFLCLWLDFFGSVRSWPDDLISFVTMVATFFGAVFLLVVPFLMGIGGIKEAIVRGKWPPTEMFSDPFFYVAILIPLVAIAGFYFVHKKVKQRIVKIILFGFLSLVWLLCGMYLSAQYTKV